MLFCVQHLTQLEKEEKYSEAARDSIVAVVVIVVSLNVILKCFYFKIFYSCFFKKTNKQKPNKTPAGIQ